jgi:hypothetical protein
MGSRSTFASCSCDLLAGSIVRSDKLLGPTPLCMWELQSCLTMLPLGFLTRVPHSLSRAEGPGDPAQGRHVQWRLPTGRGPLGVRAVYRGAPPSSVQEEGGPKNRLRESLPGAHGADMPQAAPVSLPMAGPRLLGRGRRNPDLDADLNRVRNPR